MSANAEVDRILSRLQSNCKAQEMKNYIQHGRVSTYEHCDSVARLSYLIDCRLSLRSDLNVLLTGAFLHDFYLYDWHADDGGTHRLHGFRHATTARDNARKYFGIDDRTGRVIARHMWPLNPARLPRSREEWIVCVADKCVSLYETVFRKPIRFGGRPS